MLVVVWVRSCSSSVGEMGEKWVWVRSGSSSVGEMGEMGATTHGLTLSGVISSAYFYLVYCTASYV